MKGISLWLFKLTHRRALAEIKNDANHALSLGKSKRDGIYIALKYLGLW